MPYGRSLTSSLLAAACGLFALTSCGGDEPADAPADKPETKAPATQDKGPPTPEQQALEGPARPALLLGQAWFWKDASGKPNPGPARLDIWREGEDGTWGYTRLEDGDSNVFHKAIAWRDGILTIGAEKAMLKHWTFADGKWGANTLWEKNWGGKFQRLRDIEIGDVDGDGVDELVIATHDAGVVAVVEVAEDMTVQVTEMDQKADTFVHEIELGDVDGDGKLEFFSTPSDRNKAGASQAGGVAMYSWNGSEYVRSWVDEQHGTHAKEILTADVDGDGTHELFSVLEAELEDKKIVKPVTIRQYSPKKGGGFEYTEIATIDDRQTRFLIPGDFDGDGQVELVAAAFKSGLFLIEPPTDGGESWTTTRFDAASSGFEHAAYAADLDGDGALELYVAADDQRELKRYSWNAERKTFDKSLLGRLDSDVITWNITTAEL